MTPDPLSVPCPDCMAPAAVACHVQDASYSHHASRDRAAELRNVEHGTCDLCGRPMVRGAVAGVEDAWHPDPADAGCPSMPDPTTEWTAYALAVNLGLSAGHPGPEHFVPATAPEPRVQRINGDWITGQGDA